MNHPGLFPLFFPIIGASVMSVLSAASSRIATSDPLSFRC
jgi:hypothetical protein